MTEPNFDLAVRTWIGQQIERQASQITDVRFDCGNDGYCETCWSPYAAITFKVDGREDDRQLEFENPGEWVATIARIATELAA